MAGLVSVQGDFQRVIRLDTPLDTAYQYFTDFGYILPRLPDIERVLRYKDNRYRMIFTADDGRNHKMGIVFDIRHKLVDNQHIQMISVPVSRQELNSSESLSRHHMPCFPGLFSGEVIFNALPHYIEITYRVNLLVEIEIPSFLNFMPRIMMQRLGDSLMQFKLHSVGDGFAHRLASDFTEWDKLKGCQLAQVGASLPEAQHRHN